MSMKIYFPMKIQDTGDEITLVKSKKIGKRLWWNITRALRSVEETQSLIRIYESMKKDCILPSESKAWLELGKKINRLR